MVTRDCESHVLLSLQLRRVNRLGIEVKSRARLRMTQQSLNCLNVFALVDKKGREAVTEIVEAESLTRRILSAAIMLAQGRSALHLCRRENPVVRLRIERINSGQETPYRSPYR